jgi:hypothetical protein
MTYRIPRAHQIRLSYDAPGFLCLLHSAQDGDQVSRDMVILATMPLVFNLTTDEDEVAELVVHLFEKVLPRWVETYLWAGHVKRLLTWRLQTLRREAQRRRTRGF